MDAPLLPLLSLDGPVLVFGGCYSNLKATMALRHEAERKMRERWLPAGYAEAQETGLWPSRDVLPPHELSERGTALSPAAYRWKECKAA